jgi:MoaA/NifB/PqqE/SkfB family radical SAM enzyme
VAEDEKTGDIMSDKPAAGSPALFNAAFLSGISDTLRCWALWNPKRMYYALRTFWCLINANKRRALIHRREGVLVPPLIILSVTMRCNLSCANCYSRDYPMDNELSINKLDDLFKQAHEIGVHFFVITGGEPLLRTGLTELLMKHDRLTFFLFTNGTLVDQAWAKTAGRAINIIPLISVEGTAGQTDTRRGPGVHEKALAAMRHLKEENCLFGFSTMVCRANIETVCSEDFYNLLEENGCRIGYLVNYVPSSSTADLLNVPSAEEQARVRRHVLAMQRQKRMILIHMPDDEYLHGGMCMAAGRGFVHINAQGYVEPCPFAHVATHSILESTLKQSLQSTLFAHIRDNPALLQRPHVGCALFEHRVELARASENLGARVTDKNAPVMKPVLR